MLSGLPALAGAFFGGHGCQRGSEEEDLDFTKRLDRAPIRLPLSSLGHSSPMSAPTPRPSELSTKILEHVLPHPPDRDIIKVEAVRALWQHPCSRALTLPKAPDQLTLSGPCSQFTCHLPPIRTLFSWFGLQSPQPLRVGRTSEAMRRVW